MTLRLIDPKYYLTKLQDVVRFIINPSGHPTDNKTTVNKLTDLIVLVFITLTFSLTAFYFNTNYIKPIATTRLFELQQRLGTTYFFLFSVFLIPLIEESYYRLPLKFTSLFLSISFTLISYKYISKIFFNSLMYDISSYPMTRITFALLAGLTLYLIIRRDKINFALDKFWSNNFRWVLYISCLTFAFLHINNYEHTYGILLLTPLITLPQLFLGLTTSYMRINYGFVYSFLLHALYNSSQYWLPF